MRECFASSPRGRSNASRFEPATASPSSVADPGPKTFLLLVYRWKERPFHGTAIDGGPPEGETFGEWLGRIHAKAPEAEGIDAVVRAVECPAPKNP
jgi:hypothetical protein